MGLRRLHLRLLRLHLRLQHEQDVRGNGVRMRSRASRASRASCTWNNESSRNLSSELHTEVGRVSSLSSLGGQHFRKGGRRRRGRGTRRRGRARGLLLLLLTLQQSDHGFQFRNTSVRTCTRGARHGEKVKKRKVKKS
jgi:hypothetical protein